MTFIRFLVAIYLAPLINSCGTSNYVAPETSQDLAITGGDLGEVLASDPWLLMGSWHQVLPLEASELYSAGYMTFMKGNPPNQPTMTTTRVLRADGSTTQQTRSYSEAIAWLKGKMSLVSEDIIFYNSNQLTFVRITPRQYPPEDKHKSSFDQQLTAQLTSYKRTLDDCAYPTDTLRIFDLLKKPNPADSLISALPQGIPNLGDSWSSLEGGTKCPGIIRVTLLAVSLAELAHQSEKSGQKAEAQAFLQLSIEIGQSIADVAIGFSPAGRAKDIIESLSGYSLLPPDFRELSSLDRILSAVGAVTLGAPVLKTAAKIIESTQAGVIAAKGAKAAFSSADEVVDAAKVYGISANGLKVFATLHDAIRTLPGKLKVHRIREGTKPEKIAIIGRSMGDPSKNLVGVRDAAAHFKSKGIVAEIFEPSPTATNDFLIDVTTYREKIGNATALLPNELVKNTLQYKENLTWVAKLKQEGFYVLDGGNPNNLTDPSVFYDMEKSHLF